jgi:hypothetical protein
LTAEDDRRLLAAYVAAAVVPRARTDRRKYPLYVGRVAPLGMDVLAREVEDALERLGSQGIADREIAQAFGNPTRIVRAIHTFNDGMRGAGVPKARRQALVLRLVRIAQELKAGDVLCRDGNNLVLSAEEAEELAGSVEPESVSEPARRDFQGLAATLWSAAEALYFACHGVAREQHGTYRLAGGEWLIVRDYRELTPTELWPDLPPLPFSSVRLLAWHAEDPEVEWDAFNNLYLNGPPLTVTLSAVAVLAGEDVLSVESLGGLTRDLLGLLGAVTRRIDSWEEHEVARQYLRILWWQVEPLLSLAGRGWQPPDVVFERLVSLGVGPHSDKQPEALEIERKMDLL